MKSVKKIVKFLIGGTVVLVLLLFLLPFLFRGQIENKLKDEVNDTLNASFDYESSSISLLKDFPSVSLSLSNATLTGIDTFQDVELVAVDQVDISFDLIDVIRNSRNPQITSLHFDKPVVNLKVNKSGDANYLITKKDNGDTSAFKLEIKDYSIDQGILYYGNQKNNVDINLVGIYHEGRGDFTAQRFDLFTKSTIDTIDITSGKISMMTDGNAKIQATVGVDLDYNVFTLKENTWRLNDLDFEGDSSLTLIDEGGFEVDAVVKSKDATTSAFMSILPNIQKDKIRNLESRGVADIDLTIKGLYDSVKNRVPRISLNGDLNNGYLKDRKSGVAMDGIRIDMALASIDDNGHRYKIDIPTFRFSIDGQPFSGQITTKGSGNDQYVSAGVDGKIDLEKITRILPVEGITNISGDADIDMRYKGGLDADFTTGNSIDLMEGDIVLENFQLSHKSLKQDISFSSASAELSLKEVAFEANQVVYGVSRVNVSGKVDRPLSINSTSKVTGSININGERLDLNEWITSKTETTDVASMPYQFDIDMDLDIDQVLYDVYPIENLKGKAKGGLDHMTISSSTGLMSDSDFNVTGKLDGIGKFLYNEGILSGNLSIKSQSLDVNKIMLLQQSDNKNVKKFFLNERWDITVDSDIEKVIYKSMEIADVNGIVEIEGAVLSMDNMKGKTMGGEMALHGILKLPKNGESKFSIKYDIEKILLQEAFKKMKTFSTLAPVVKYMDGFFSSTLIMEGGLDDNFFPELGTLTSSGFFETFNSKLASYPPLAKVGDKLGISSLKGLDLTNTKNWFEIKDGSVQLKERSFSSLGLPMTIKGNYEILGDIDFSILTSIPREMLKNNEVAKGINTGLEFLEESAGMLGLDLDQGENIDIQIGLTGNGTNPDVKITPIGSSGKSLGEEVKDNAKEVVESEIDTLKTRAQTKVDSMVEDKKKVIETKLDTLVSDGKEKAKDKLDSLIKNEVADTLTDILSDKAKDVLGENAEEEIEKLKDKIKDWNPFGKKKKEK